MAERRAIIAKVQGRLYFAEVVDPEEGTEDPPVMLMYDTDDAFLQQRPTIKMPLLPDTELPDCYHLNMIKPGERFKLPTAVELREQDFERLKRSLDAALRNTSGPQAPDQYLTCGRVMPDLAARFKTYVESLGLGLKTVVVDATTDPLSGLPQQQLGVTWW
jgi:hypothetical protein